MKYSVYAIIFLMGLGASSYAFAQSSASSSDVIMQRLDELDKRNAKLASENAALRDRVRTLEVGKHSALRVVSSPTQPSPGAAMAMVQRAPAGEVYKSPTAFVAAAYNWTGFYVGAHFGGGLGRTDWTDNSPLVCVTSPCASIEAGSHNATGLLGGAQAGYNWQAGHWVMGIEGQYSFANLNGTHQNNVADSSAFGLVGVESFSSIDRLTTKVDGIGSIAGRIGFASESLDRTLFFVKGGAAFARARYSDQFNASGTLCSGGGSGFACAFVSEGGTFKDSENRWGWTAGIGMEYGLTQNLSASIEYDYFGFGTKTVNFQGSECVTSTFGGPASTTCAPITRPFNINQNIQLLKFGLNYRLNYPQ